MDSDAAFSALVARRHSRPLRGAAKWRGAIKPAHLLPSGSTWEHPPTGCQGSVTYSACVGNLGFHLAEEDAQVLG